MPPTGKVTYTGYGDVSSVKRIRDKIKAFFEQTAKDLDTDIKIVMANGKAYPERRSIDKDFKGLVIYDFSTASDEPGAGPYGHGNILISSSVNHTETVYLEHVPYMVKLPDADPSMEMINAAWLADEAQYGVSTIGSYVFQTLWVNTGLANFTSKSRWEWLIEPMKNACDPQFWDGREERQFEELRKNFSKHLVTSITHERETQKEIVNQCETSMATYYQNIIQLTRKMHLAIQRLKFAEERRGKEEEFYEVEFHELMKNVRVQKLSWDQANLALIVKTDLLYLYSPTGDERTPLGEFEIKIHQNGSIMMFNKTNMRAGKMTPHVTGKGDPCWGSSQQQVLQLAASSEISSLVQVCINYLEQYNPNDDHASSAAYWFTKEETEVKDKKGAWVLKKDLKDEEQAVKGEAQIDDSDVLTEEQLEVH